MMKDWSTRQTKFLQGNQAMQDLIIIAAVLAGWLILNVWILPKFGVST
jgi:hypothetical protein